MQIQPIKNVSNFKQDVQYKKYSKENSLEVINLIKQKLVPADDYVKDCIKRLTKMIYEFKNQGEAKDLKIPESYFFTIKNIKSIKK